MDSSAEQTEVYQQTLSTAVRWKAIQLLGSTAIDSVNLVDSSGTGLLRHTRSIEGVILSPPCRLSHFLNVALQTKIKICIKPNNLGFVLC